jgi:hypothetical protein
MDTGTKVLLFSAVSQVCVGIVSVIAIFRAPIVALKVQESKESSKDVAKRQYQLFRTLMTYRATPLSVHFVQALNSIDLEFSSHSEKDQQIREAWTVLLDHFTHDQAQPDFGARNQELIIKLLSKMGTALGFNFDEVYLRRHSYYPIAHGSIEEEQNELRRLLLELLRTNRRLPVSVFEEKFPDLAIPAKDTSLNCSTGSA